MDDSIWDPTQQVQTVYFSNSAKWGEYSSTTKTEVKHESQIISKKGQYDNSTGYVRYSVVINPDKLMLGTDKMIELVDDMHPDGNESNTAALVRSTVKLYSYDPTAPDKKGAEIADGVYTVDYKETQKISATIISLPSASRTVMPMFWSMLTGTLLKPSTA